MARRQEEELSRLPNPRCEPMSCTPRYGGGAFRGRGHVTSALLARRSSPRDHQHAAVTVLLQDPGPASMIGLVLCIQGERQKKENTVPARARCMARGHRCSPHDAATASRRRRLTSGGWLFRGSTGAPAPKRTSARDKIMGARSSRPDAGTGGNMGDRASCRRSHPSIRASCMWRARRLPMATCPRLPWPCCLSPLLFSCIACSRDPDPAGPSCFALSYLPLAVTGDQRA